MFLFFPYRIDRKLKAMPWLTIAIIFINTVIYLGVLPIQENVWDALGFRANPAGAPSPSRRSSRSRCGASTKSPRGSWG